MTVSEAKKFVASKIARIGNENPVGELRPWELDACPAASEHWGRVQQRIALGEYKGTGEVDVTLKHVPPAPQPPTTRCQCGTDDAPSM